MARARLLGPRSHVSLALAALLSGAVTVPVFAPTSSQAATSDSTSQCPVGTHPAYSATVDSSTSTTYCIIKVVTSVSLTLPAGVQQFDYVLVGGGGGGGFDRGGGGGAGGVAYETNNALYAASRTLQIVVGSGGATGSGSMGSQSGNLAGADGGTSTLTYAKSISETRTVQAGGGGGGGSHTGLGSALGTEEHGRNGVSVSLGAGGSGGGASMTYIGNDTKIPGGVGASNCPSPMQCFAHRSDTATVNGRVTAGGGGAGSIGIGGVYSPTTIPDGGAGWAEPLLGLKLAAGGGGAQADSYNTPPGAGGSVGGVEIGGHGDSYPTSTALTSPLANSGSGGGGGANGAGSDGAAGVAVIRYAVNATAASECVAPTDSYTVDAARTPGSCILAITRSATVTLPSNVTSFDYVLVGGGGGGGSNRAGGGGSGGVVYEAGAGVSAGGTLTIEVGAGGAAGLYSPADQSLGTSGVDGGTTRLSYLRGDSTQRKVQAGGGGGGGTHINTDPNTPESGRDGRAIDAGAVGAGGSGGGASMFYASSRVQSAGAAGGRNCDAAMTCLNSSGSTAFSVGTTDRYTGGGGGATAAGTAASASATPIGGAGWREPLSGRLVAGGGGGGSGCTAFTNTRQGTGGTVTYASVTTVIGGTGEACSGGTTRTSPLSNSGSGGGAGSADIASPVLYGTGTAGAAGIVIIRYAVPTYTVTYNAGTNGAGSVGAQTFGYGESVTLRSDTATFTRSGYTLSSWSTSDLGTQNYSLGGMYGTNADLTLYPVWSPNTYSVTYDSQGGSATAASSFTFGSGFALAAAPSRNGYRFLGWFAAGSGGSALSSPYTPASPGALTLYAQWVKTWALNTVVSLGSGGFTTSIAADADGRFDTATAVVVTAVPSNGFHFANWTGGCAGASGDTCSVTLLQDETVSASFSGNTYTVSFNATANGGSAIVPAAADFTVGSSSPLTLPTPAARAGYTLSGWFDASSGGNYVGAAGDPFTPSQTLTLYAVWTPNQYGFRTSFFNQFLQSWSQVTQLATYTGTPYSTPGAPGAAPAGFPRFAGWCTDDVANGQLCTGTLYKPATALPPPAASTWYLYDLWSLALTLTYDTNGGGSAPAAVSSLATGDTLTVTASVPTRTGRTFTGWCTVATADLQSCVSAAGSAYASSSAFTMSNASATLYSVWAIETETVTYAAGVGGVVSGTWPVTVNYGDTTTATATASTGYHFTQWSDGVLTATRVDTISATLSVTANFTLDTHTVTYAAGTGGAVNGTWPVTVNYGDTTTATATASTGYHFTGWSDGVMTATRVDTITTTLSVTANFVLETMTVTYAAGTGGQVSGSWPAVKNYGDTTTATATASTGYHFTGWSDGILTTSRIDTITATLSVTANFVLDTHTVTYAAGVGGAVNGTWPAVKNYGDTTTATATASTGYHFTGWSDGILTTSRIDTITATLSVTANFVLDTHTVTYAAGIGGAVNGSWPQIANYGDTTTATATASTGYHFTQWSDGVMTATRVDTISAVLFVTANFVLDTLTVTYAAGIGGAVNGSWPQIANYGDTTTATATASTGYHFTGWSDGILTTTRVDTITATLSVTANFVLDTHTVTYAAGAGGQNSGSWPTVKNYGDTTTATASASTGYHFTQWSDGVLTATRVDTITATLSVTANFVLDTHTVTYAAGVGGAVNGTWPAVKNYGDTTTATASASTGYHFTGWSDGILTTSRIDTITATLSVTANFELDTNTAGPTLRSFVVQYDGNGASGTAPAPCRFLFGAACDITRDAGTLSRLGYDFAGWNTRSDGSGVTYSLGTRYSTASDLVLYAMWSAHVFTLTLHDGVSEVQIRFIAQQPVILPEPTDRTGSTFAGWFTAESGGTRVTSPLLPPETDSSLFAQWTPIAPSKLQRSRIAILFTNRTTMVRVAAKAALTRLATSLLGARSVVIRCESLYAKSKRTKLGRKLALYRAFAACKTLRTAGIKAKFILRARATSNRAFARAGRTAIFVSFRR